MGTWSHIPPSQKGSNCWMERGRLKMEARFGEGPGCESQLGWKWGVGEPGAQFHHVYPNSLQSENKWPISLPGGGVSVRIQLLNVGSPPTSLPFPTQLCLTQEGRLVHPGGDGQSVPLSNGRSRLTLSPVAERDRWLVWGGNTGGRSGWTGLGSHPHSDRGGRHGSHGHSFILLPSSDESNTQSHPSNTPIPHPTEGRGGEVGMVHGNRDSWTPRHFPTAPLRLAGESLHHPIQGPEGNGVPGHPLSKHHSPLWPLGQLESILAGRGEESPDTKPLHPRPYTRLSTPGIRISQTMSSGRMVPWKGKGGMSNAWEINHRINFPSNFMFPSSNLPVSIQIRLPDTTFDPTPTSPLAPHSKRPSNLLQIVFGSWETMGGCCELVFRCWAFPVPRLCLTKLHPGLLPVLQVFPSPCLCLLGCLEGLWVVGLEGAEVEPFPGRGGWMPSVDAGFPTAVKTKCTP